MMDCADCAWTGPRTKTEAHRRATGHSLYYDESQIFGLKKKRDDR